MIAQCSHEAGEVISPIFLTPKSDGDGFRLILNLKKLNEVAQYHHFKMETLKTILTLVSPGIFMCKLDIKDAYYSVPIKIEDQKLLKFEFDGVLYKFLCLPNGYTGGPRKFTKLLKPVLAHLRQQGITIAAFLDDLIILGIDAQTCYVNLITTMNLLQHLGFVINFKKSSFIPSTKLEFLGVIIDSLSMEVTLTKEKKSALRHLCLDT